MIINIVIYLSSFVCIHFTYSMTHKYCLFISQNPHSYKNSSLRFPCYKRVVNLSQELVPFVIYNIISFKI